MKKVRAKNGIAGVHELADVSGSRPFEQLVGRRDLFDAAFTHHDDPIGES